MENSSKAIVRRYLEEVVSTGNLERVSEFVAPADAPSHLSGCALRHPMFYAAKSGRTVPSPIPFDGRQRLPKAARAVLREQTPPLP